MSGYGKGYLFPPPSSMHYQNNSKPGLLPLSNLPDGNRMSGYGPGLLGSGPRPNNAGANYYYSSYGGWNNNFTNAYYAGQSYSQGFQVPYGCQNRPTGSGLLQTPPQPLMQINNLVPPPPPPPPPPPSKGGKSSTPGQKAGKINDEKQQKQVKNQEILHCDPCEREFQSVHDKEQHMRSHVKCEVEGCGFVASKKMQQCHYIQVHETGKFKINLTTNADIEKWKEDRKRNYPTCSKAVEKELTSEKRKQSGSVLQTKTFSYKGKGSWNNQQPVVTGTSNSLQPAKELNNNLQNKNESSRIDSSCDLTAGKSIEADGVGSTKNESNGVTNKATVNPVNSILSNSAPFNDEEKRRSELLRNYMFGFGSSDSDSDSSDESSNDERLIQGKKINENSCNELETKNVCEMGESFSDEKAGSKNDFDEKVEKAESDFTKDASGETIIFGRNSAQDDSVTQNTGDGPGELATDIGKTTNTVATDVGTDIGKAANTDERGNDTRELTTGSECLGQENENTELSTRYSGDNTSEILSSEPTLTETTETLPRKTPKEQNNRKRRGNDVERNKHAYNNKKARQGKPTLLEMLLAKDIRHERNVILQCIRHVVLNDFFKNKNN